MNSLSIRVLYNARPLNSKNDQHKRGSNLCLDGKRKPQPLIARPPEHTQTQGTDSFQPDNNSIIQTLRIIIDYRVKEEM